MAEVGFTVVWQEVLCGSHELSLVVESICKTWLLGYLAKNEDTSMLVGQWAKQNIVDALATRNYTIYNLCTLTSFGHKAHREHAEISHSTSCIFFCFECVRLACVCAFCSQLECACRTIIDRVSIWLSDNNRSCAYMMIY